jgi:hypothetical protein
MVEKYTRLLVTKLSPSVHDRLKELAKRDRRTLSAYLHLKDKDAAMIKEFYELKENESSLIGHNGFRGD